MRIGISIILLICLIFLAADEKGHAGNRRMLGPNVTMSWASSYLSIESTAVNVEKDTSWTYASSTGWFFDYLVNPYISLRTNWFFYPALINTKPCDLGNHSGEIPLHEMGFSVLRHFNLQPLNPWFGAGPFMQFSTVDDPNSYILHAILSLGFDYEFTDETFFCPEFMWGIGTRLVSSKDETVQIDVPTGKDFTSSGIVIFFKLGVGKSF